MQDPAVDDTTQCPTCKGTGLVAQGGTITPADAAEATTYRTTDPTAGLMECLKAIGARAIASWTGRESLGGDREIWTLYSVDNGARFYLVQIRPGDNGWGVWTKVANTEDALNAIS